MIDNEQFLPPDKVFQFMKDLIHVTGQIEDAVTFIQEFLSDIKLSRTEHDILVNFYTVYHMCVDKEAILKDRYENGEGITNIHVFDAVTTIRMLTCAYASAELVILFNDNIDPSKKRANQLNTIIINECHRLIMKHLPTKNKESRGK